MIAGAIPVNYWTACRWPHVVLSAEQMREVEEEIARWRPYMHRRATWMARGDRVITDELEQAAMIMLWMFRAGKANPPCCTQSASYIRGAINRRMLMILRTERRAA